MPVKETPLNEVPAGREAFPTPVTPRVSWPKRDPGASTNASVRTLIVIEIVCRFMAVSPLKESSVPLYDVSASDRRRCTTRCRCVRIRAMAVSVCEAFDAVVVFHETEYGEAVASAPRFAPSSWNWTPTTPTLSDALAETVIVPETVEPDVGLVMESVGGVVSAVELLTV